MHRRLIASSTLIVAVVASIGVLSGPAHAATAPTVSEVSRAVADASNEGLFFPVVPTRLLDTRNGTGGSHRMGAGATIVLQVAGRNGLPAVGVSAVTMTLTSVSPSASTYLTAYPSDVSRPNVSSLNVTAGVTRANTITLPVASSGSVAIFNNAGSIDVVADVTGYYANDGLGTGHGAGAGVDLTNLRLLDTREPWESVVQPGQTITVSTYGDSSDSAAYVNITAVSPTRNGYLKAWSGIGSPNISTVNFQAGASAVANTAAVGLRTSGSDGVFSIQNRSAGTVHVVVDLLASYSTSFLFERYYPITPTRVLDTRVGTGVPKARLTPGNLMVNLPQSLKSTDSTSVYGIVGDATIVKPSAKSYLLFWDGGDYKPSTSTVNGGPGEIIANGTMSSTNFDSGNVTVYQNAGTADAILDVSGIFAEKF